MRELTCIVCPVGCSLFVEEGSVPEISVEKSAPVDNVPDLTITGNRCPRGIVYAKEEIRSPKRVVTATCGIVFPVENSAQGDRPFSGLTAPRRVPVKTSAACPREKIPLLLEDIYRVKLTLPVKAGDRPIINWKGNGIDVVVVRDLE